MLNAARSARLCVLCVLLFPVGSEGNDLYVSPAGTPSGPGTMAQPYDLATALAGQLGQPGDTFWLRGGSYVIGHVDTKIEGAPGQPITFRQLPAEWARIDGSLTFYESMGNVVLRDFELYSSDTNRLSAQMGAGFAPTDIRPVIGIACFSPNFSFINLVVHDHTRSGIYISEVSTNTRVYGCVLYNNGWASPDNAEGHSCYVQSRIGTRELADNVAFNAAGVNFHIYENHSGGRLTGVTLDGNVAFHAGALQAVRRYQDWIVGVDLPAISADKIVLKNNMGYLPPASAAQDQVQIGRDGINGSVALLNNYLPLGLSMNNWTIAAVAGNLFAAGSRNYIVNLDQSQVSLAAAWNGNSYFRSETAGAFMGNSVEKDFPDWQNATGYDRNSSYVVGQPGGTRVFIRPNRYEPGRANLIVYNWNNLDTVPVDVSSVLTAGSAYEVRNAADFFAAPVLSGVFDGQPLSLPMTGLTVAAPNGPLLTPPPTGPAFNVFILLPRFVRLQATAVDGQAQVSWTTNSGNWSLQFTENLPQNNGWTDDTNVPAVVGGQYAVTNLNVQRPRFYRLRAAQ